MDGDSILRRRSQAAATRDRVLARRREDASAAAAAGGRHRSSERRVWRDFQRQKTSGETASRSSVGRPIASEWSTGVPSSSELVDAAARAREALAAVTVSPASAGTRRSQKRERGGDGRVTFGAALLARSGKVYTGASVHPSVMHPKSGDDVVDAVAAPDASGLCAERIAVVKAISEGDVEFESLYLFSDYPRGHVAPCGACRQVTSSAVVGVVVARAFVFPLSSLSLSSLSSSSPPPPPSSSPHRGSSHMRRVVCESVQAATGDVWRLPRVHGKAGPHDGEAVDGGASARRITRGPSRLYSSRRHRRGQARPRSVPRQLVERQRRTCLRAERFS
jgi:hypothetical protein